MTQRQPHHGKPRTVTMEAETLEFPEQLAGGSTGQHTSSLATVPVCQPLALGRSLKAFRSSLRLGNSIYSLSVLSLLPSSERGGFISEK